MSKTFFRLAMLMLGLWLYAVGIVCTIYANVGLSPWDVFHQGLTKHFPLTMGQASMSIGFIVVLLDWYLGEKVGIGTIANMFFIGLFMDIIMSHHLLPQFTSLALRGVELFVGMAIIGLASYFYLSAGFGSGPRDGLMVALTKKTGKSVRFVRNCIELSVVILGIFLGGSFGFGTIIMAFTGGYFVQFAFKVFKFKVTEVKHEFVEDTFKKIKLALESN